VHTYEQLYIGGRWVDPAGPDTIDVLSPHSGEVVGRAPAADPEDVDRAVAAAAAAFDDGEWRNTAAAERLAAVERLSDAFGKRVDEMSDLISREMGSPITFSQLAQGAGAAMVLASSVHAGRGYPWESTRPGFLGDDVVVRREPVGVVAAIVPWNAPQFLTLSKLAPALLAGCSIVVKPAPETPLDALLLGEIVDEAGLPEGVVSILPGWGETGEQLVQHPRVDKVAFTGSTATGRRIAAACGEQLKRVSLELGGKSAAIVLDDADIASTVAGLRFASFMNSGQACIAQTRVVVSRSRHDELVAALAEMVASLKVGDPADPETEIGPLVSQRQQQRVEGYIIEGRDEGARLVVGGTGRPDDLPAVASDAGGWYVRPTLFAGVDNRMRIAQEEIFGPVLSVIPCDDQADAIRIANDSPYGLAGSIWTADVDHGVDVARRIRAGTFGINKYTSDFLAPFGGFKASGIGRENGPEGIDAYTELKSIVS
jgi:betaine-aldehyde dehydrogenase